jgi:hypothetical protein
MGRWSGAIVETNGRIDFWTIARKHGVEPLSSAIPERVLIECNDGFDPWASAKLAEALSRDVGAGTLGFHVDTNVDTHLLQAFHAGARVRRLDYAREGRGWEAVEGSVQSWERAYFFDLDSTTAPGEWPEMLADDGADEDLARYEMAKRAGDATPVLDLLRPSSVRAIRRACAFLNVQPDSPSARWRRPSFWSRLFSGR